MFIGAGNEKAIGEASTATLYFNEASILLIKLILGDPKIIIMLRKPTNSALSIYTHPVRDEYENQTFEDAMIIEYQRVLEGYRVSYHHKKRALYADQVKSFINDFSSVKVIIYEELKRIFLNNPRSLHVPKRKSKLRSTQHIHHL